ncbi:MAG TPA: DMT family transporter [Candidatus Acetothermia bacterium]|nr:DMT family transporter [Candidatus Acetothermia bacterium]
MRILPRRQGWTISPLIAALFAAGLFGLSAPLAKLLLGTIDPLPLASLLYLGAGLGLAGYILVARIFVKRPSEEARLERGDLPWLAGATLSGGVIAPILLLYGLRTTPAATASLILTFEIVATGLIAATVFGEFIGRWTWGAILTVSGGTVLLTLRPGASWEISAGAALIVAACVLWGLDNNLTRHISLRDPKRIVLIKGLAAGGVSLALALGLHKPFPEGSGILLGLLLGSLSYGISIALFVRALRGLGAARTGALFGTAPFIGAAVSFALFRELPPVTFFISLPLLAIGAGILFREPHAHVHSHLPLTHTHAHTHTDGHHAHPHRDPITRHSHRHTHTDLRHSHPHRPDTHHRHRHTPAGGDGSQDPEA